MAPKFMRRQNTFFLLAFFSCLPLIWYLASPAVVCNDRVMKSHPMAWQVPQIGTPKDMKSIRDSLLKSTALGFVAATPKAGVLKKESALHFYGVLLTTKSAYALVGYDDDVQLVEQGKINADGSTLLAVSMNSIRIRLRNGREKAVFLYDEKL